MTDNPVNADPAELAKFSDLAHRWWDPESEFRPLHQINPLRLAWIEGQMPLADKEGVIRVVVAILNPEGKTPYALHQEAVAEAEKLKLRVAELEAALWAAKGDAALLEDL